VVIGEEPTTATTTETRNTENSVRRLAAENDEQNKMSKIKKNVYRFHETLSFPEVHSNAIQNLVGLETFVLKFPRDSTCSLLSFADIQITPLSSSTKVLSPHDLQIILWKDQNHPSISLQKFLPESDDVDIECPHVYSHIIIWPIDWKKKYEFHSDNNETIQDSNRTFEQRVPLKEYGLLDFANSHKDELPWKLSFYYHISDDAAEELSSSTFSGMQLFDARISFHLEPAADCMDCIQEQIDNMKSKFQTEVTKRKHSVPQLRATGPVMEEQKVALDKHQCRYDLVSIPFKNVALKTYADGSFFTFQPTRKEIARFQQEGFLKNVTLKLHSQSNVSLFHFSILFS
jgi:hypothetical protein